MPNLQNSPGLPDRTILPDQSGLPNHSELPNQPTRPQQLNVPDQSDLPKCPKLPIQPGRQERPNLPDRSKLPNRPKLPKLYNLKSAGELAVHFLPKMLNCLTGELFASDCIFCAKDEWAKPDTRQTRPRLPNFRGRKICSACAFEIKGTKTGNLLIETNGHVQVLPYASLSPYEGKARALILRLKTVQDEALVMDLAELLSHPLAVLINHIYKDQSLSKPPLIVPVPLHEKRLKERGFNQSELIARALAGKLARLPCARRWTDSKAWKQPHLANPQKQYLAAAMLERIRDTESQHGLPMPRRSANMDGAFRVSAAIEDRPIIIIDDVLTSGATAGNCAAAIYSALSANQVAGAPDKAIKIAILTVARARWRQ